MLKVELFQLEIPMLKILPCDLRKNIGIVSQDPFYLIQRCWKISSSLSQSNEEDVINALKTANAWKFVKQLPDELNSLIGERA